MLSDKDLKKKYRPVFWRNPDKYFATGVLKDEGFERKICPKCKKPFWTVNHDQKICGDPVCNQGAVFTFIHNTPAKRKMNYIDVWKEFAKMFKKFGYTPIKRYPLVARWNPTMEYTNASIAAFQPYVISGEIKPPANPLVIPQFCMRFVDVDNVGITQSHHTGFVMIGQHMFVEPKDWDQNQVFRHIHSWLRDGVGTQNTDITYHEDAWAGGGNLGCCMEFFSRGCELGNQVYMLYDQKPSGVKDLNIKVLDMGMGMERVAWFTQGTNTIYDAVFPTVLKKMFIETGFKYDKSVIDRYIPYAGKLNIDEVDNVDKAWDNLANEISVDKGQLKANVIPLSGLYSIAEHMRGILFAINDGALPSNIGFGYNLRMLIRRSLSFIHKYDWNLYLPDICNEHAKYLKPIFPELSESVELVGRILEVEMEKYDTTRNKSKQIISKLLTKSIDEKKLLEVYDSNGIPPDMIAEEAKTLGKSVKIPEDFYSKVSELHEKKEEKEEKAIDIDLKGIPDTELLYYKNDKTKEAEATVLKVSGDCVILDKTIFYPVSGGQDSDQGTISGKKMMYAEKVGGVVVHTVKKSGFRKGKKAKLHLDWNRRKQLTINHTSIHLINISARKVLGEQVWQAGSNKVPEKAHLDITHFQSITEDELDRIEKLANELIKKKIKVNKAFLPKDEAEKKYGMRLYQGGAVPGKTIRVVSIGDLEHEACGGTHLDNTSEAGRIIILNTERIQDGIDRITIKAGSVAQKFLDASLETVKEIILRMKPLGFKFSKQFKEKLDKELAFKELRKGAGIFSVNLEQVPGTLKKFLKGMEDNKKEMEYIEKKSGLKSRIKESKELDSLSDAFQRIFDEWKNQGKEIERMRLSLAKVEARRLMDRVKDGKVLEILRGTRKDLLETAKELLIVEPKVTAILANQSGDIVVMSKTADSANILKAICQKCGGSGGGSDRLAQGKVELSKLRKVIGK